MLDIKRILTDHNIHWVDRGNNVAKNNINIRCPLCKDDPSEHMGIRPDTGWWACWRSSDHRGKNIYKLLNILEIHDVPSEGVAEFNRLVQGTFFDPAPLSVQPIAQHTYITTFPREFIQINSDLLDIPYISYLKRRGFSEPEKVIERYHLMRSTNPFSVWAYRIIFPVLVDNKVSWTGRSINRSRLRYLSPSGVEARSVKDCLLFFNNLLSSKAKTLVIVEGPFDALKVDYYFSPTVRVTCLFGIMISNTQIKLMRKLVSNYNNVAIILDRDTFVEASAVGKALSFCSPIIINTPKKDVGDMSVDEIQYLLASI